MYQYKGILKKSKEIIAEGHSVEDIENQVLSWRRKAKKGEHTFVNVPVEVVHVQRNQVEGKLKTKLIKII